LKPVITVGLCVRNGECLLRNAVDSIINQDFPSEKVQVIFVDDGSVDRTPKIIQEYLEYFGSRAKFFQSSWKGLGHARNLITKQSEGEYLLFVDADEVLTKNYITMQVDVMEKNPTVAITAGVFKTVPGNWILNLEVAPYIVNQKRVRSKNFIWATDKLIGTGGTTFRLSALRQTTGFNENIKGSGEDTDLVLRIKKAGWFIRPNKAELYELHGGLSTPKELWKKYFWYGYGCQKSFRQTRESYSFPRMSPFAGFVTGVFYSIPAYKLLHQKVVFLLPIHFGAKLAAWTLGFMKGQLES
jgi:glycosyltransferase involved in cell wall biosynthesis